MKQSSQFNKYDNDLLPNPFYRSTKKGLNSGTVLSLSQYLLALKAGPFCRNTRYKI